MMFASASCTDTALSPRRLAPSPQLITAILALAPIFIMSFSPFRLMWPCFIRENMLSRSSFLPRFYRLANQPFFQERFERFFQALKQSVCSFTGVYFINFSTTIETRELCDFETGKSRGFCRC